MRTIDDEVRFHLSREGWYLGQTEIEVSDRVEELEVVTAALNVGCHALLIKGKIYISKTLATFASLPQRRLAILHEYAHSVLKHVDPHRKEYACDEWALKKMISSGLYNFNELLDAISLFGEIITEGESDTHPSSQSRHKRLMGILREYVS